MVSCIYIYGNSSVLPSVTKLSKKERQEMIFPSISHHPAGPTDSIDLGARQLAKVSMVLAGGGQRAVESVHRRLQKTKKC